ISIVKEGEPLLELAPDIDTLHLRDVSFSELFKKSISYETAADGIVDEISLPGIQDKISANLISFPVKTKRKNKAYILKLNPSDKPLLVENEHFFLEMADDCGIETAKSEVVVDRNNESGLLVERFDRIFTSKQDYPTKVHQEDACQFLDRYPADKYTQISCRMIAEGIEKFCAAPIIEIAKFLKLIGFSYLIGNGDFHAKNVSIHTSCLTNRTELTPAYDLLSTLPYGDNRMALKFEGRDDNLKKSDFVTFGKRHGVNEGVVASMLNELCEKSFEWSKRVGEIGFSAKKTKHLTSVMLKRCSDILGAT
ncbi:HipA domain-containing protein, partial [bacterium]|nr:HipA domain-containing protein [bacterium]